MIKLTKIILNKAQCVICDNNLFVKETEDGFGYFKCRRRCLYDYTYDSVLNLLEYYIDNENYKYHIKIYNRWSSGDTYIYQYDKRSSKSIDFLQLEEMIVFETIAEVENYIFI